MNHQASQQRQPATQPKVLPTASIGKALAQLKEEFPDVTVSKIRFLETEGLVTPQRAASGYRRYSQDDIDRLRFILRQQQSQYLPLKVIKKQLEGMDSGDISVVSPQVAIEQVEELANSSRRFTISDLAAETKASEELIRSLTDMGLIQTVSGGFYVGDDIPVIRLAQSLVEQGVEPRYLKNLLTFSKRQADWVAQVSRASMVAKGENAIERQEEKAKEISTLALALTSEIVKKNL